MRLTNDIAARRLRRITGRAQVSSEQGPRNPAPPRAKAAAPIFVISDPAREAATPNTERRRHSRAHLAHEVGIRRLGGFNFQVALRDLSVGGCRVEMLEPCAPGDGVIARLPQLEPLGSRVCWVEGTTTGVQFLTTIHPAVLDAVLARLNAGAREQRSV